MNHRESKLLLKKTRGGVFMDRFVKKLYWNEYHLPCGGISSGNIHVGPSVLMHLKFVHSHLNMLGWVSMMIFGVGYHILPRFAGKPLKSPKMGELQFWLANIGLSACSFFTPSEAFILRRIVQRGNCCLRPYGGGVRLPVLLQYARNNLHKSEA